VLHSGVITSMLSLGPEPMKREFALTPPNRATPTRYSVTCGAFLAILVFAAVSLWENPIRAASSGQSTVESAPSVKPAIDGVLDLFGQKSIVALGDNHGLAQEEDFYCALIRDPRFADEVGNVVVEFGGEASQDIIDRYVAGENIPFTELRRVWTETIGWIPGPTSLGYVNFYANVRGANLKLPREHRIKVWLGDPKIDWSKINSFSDAAPYLSRRDDNYFRIISDEILEKQKKTLLIIGTGHLFSPLGPGPLSAKIDEAYPHMLAVVSPFSGYIEPECNAKFVARAKAWPVPAIVSPVEGTWLKSELELPGCNYSRSVVSFGKGSDKPKKVITTPGPTPSVQSLGPGKPPSPNEKIGKDTAAQGEPSGVQWFGPGKAPSPEEMMKNMLSGASSDAILYLGPPDSMTMSPVDPSIYVDLDYFNEENRRLRCCTPFGGALDWDQLLLENAVAPRKFEVPR
jgi:hypothetical protein